MAVKCVMTGWCRAWLIAVVLVGGCGQVREGHAPAALAQDSSGGPQTPGKPESPAKEESSPETQRHSNYGVLHGRVTRGPIPPAPGGDRPPGPVPGGSSSPVGAAHIGAQPVGIDHVWWTVTSFDGTYAMLLPAGAYRVTMRTTPGTGVARGLPATVTVIAGQQTRLDIHVDTGLR